MPTYKFHFDEPAEVWLSNEEPLNSYFAFIMVESLTGFAPNIFHGDLRSRGVKKTIANVKEAEEILKLHG